MNILVINGVNLNMLGKRDPSVYGNKTYLDLVKMIKKHCKEKKVKVKCVKSNYEGKIVEYIQKARKKYDGIVINAGAHTHYSYALRDAISDCGVKCVEVHISNIYEREEFRHLSVIKDVCVFSVVGEGLKGYLKAIDYLI